MFNDNILSYKSNYLFPKEEMLPRESVEQSEFNASFKPMADKVMGAIHSARIIYNDFMKSHPEMERYKSFSAHFWNTAICAELSKIPYIEWDKLPGLFRRDFMKFGKSKVFIKKIDEKYNTSNIETSAVQMYREQLTNDPDDKDTVLILGYQLDETRRQIIDVSIICKKNDSIEWVTDVYELCSFENNKPFVVILNEYNTNTDDSVESQMTIKSKVISINKE